MICLDEITEPCLASPCSHRNFDVTCLLRWLTEKASCPLCQSRITEVCVSATATTGEVRYFLTSSPSVEFPVSQQPPPSHPRPRAGPDRRSSSPRQVSSDDDPQNPDVRAQEALRFRRRVYSRRVYSLHVGSSPATGFREWTREDLIEGSDFLSRARAWIRRELQVFAFLEDSDHPLLTEGRRRRNGSNAGFVLEYVVAMLKWLDLQSSSGHAARLLTGFIGERHAPLFLHELRSFLRSPYTVEQWDRHVQYPWPQEVARERHGASERQRSVPSLRQGADCYRPPSYSHHHSGDRRYPNSRGEVISSTGSLSQSMRGRTRSRRGRFIRTGIVWEPWIRVESRGRQG